MIYKFSTNLLFVVLLCFIYSCKPADNEPLPEPDPPKNGPTEPIPDDPPEDVCSPGVLNCYITLEEAGTKSSTKHPVQSTGLIQEMGFADQTLINTARNFEYAAENCAAYLHERPFNTTANELTALANIARELHDGGRRSPDDPLGHPSMVSFLGEGGGQGRLEKVNRRCIASNEWCDVTGVFRPTLDNLFNQVKDHLNTMNTIDSRGVPLAFDGIRHWCSTRLNER